LNRTSAEVDKLISDNHDNINQSFKNINQTTQSLKQVSDSVAQIDIKKITKDLEKSVANIKAVTDKIEKGQGSLGKLVQDDQLYKNLEGATKEMEELLNDIKTNPKRYVHFSVFGKKNRPYKNKDK